MTQSHDRRVFELFSAILELPAAERDDALKRQCQDDDVYEEVRQLLAAADDPDDSDDERWSIARDRLLADTFATGEDDAEDLSGSIVGSWHLREQLARGGLATIYVADRVDGEFRQKAALKVLRRGLDTDDLVARFRAEREILATLDHPSIAGILDGGALDDGRPYLVLEFVAGEAITSYCSDRNLSVADKVGLMIDVMRALHHAHKHLVVHRDVKPSNILVTDSGNVVLLDFGIAKILDPTTIPGASTATRTGVSLLTPGYGSPEQLAGKPITTASDIYQGGLVLFELLTGTRPFADEESRNTEHQLIPSRIVANATEKKRVRGDLDAIVAKATHGDPTRRYASAESMADDMTRYLSGMPVQAQPDSFAYRFSRFARRRPWVLPALVLTLIALFGYVATITVYTKRLAEEERLAVASQEFLTDLFRASDPFNPADASSGSDITVLQALELGRERVENELVDEPKLRASLLASISDVYGSLDRRDDAIMLREEALEIERHSYGESSPQVMLSLRALGSLYRNTRQPEKAENAMQKQLAIARDLYSVESVNLGLAEIAAGIDKYGAGEETVSRELLASGIDKLRPMSSEHASTMLNALISYATNLGYNAREEALETLAEADEIARASFGEGSLPLAMVQMRFASTLTFLQRWDDSEQNFRAAIPVLEDKLGIDHSYTVSALNNFAFMYLQKEDYPQAESMFVELAERQARIFGADSRAVADSNQNLGSMYAAQGRYDKAIDVLTIAYNNYRSSLNDDNYVIAYPLLTIAYSHIQLGDAKASEAAAREALARFRKTMSGTHFEGVALCLVGISLENQGAVDDGAPMVAASHELLGKGKVPENYQVLCRYSG